MVFVSVLDVNGNLIQRFPANEKDNLAEQANEHHCDIPFACGSGACMVCMCRVVQGLEYIEKEKFGKVLASISEDQILTCVAGIKSDAFAVGKEVEIVLQKMF